MTDGRIEVVVVDDHLVVRKGVTLLLAEEGIRVAGVAGALGEARSLLARRRHDVVLLDIHLGAESSLALVEELLDEKPDAAIVLYTGRTDEAAALRSAAAAGARGFVVKTSPTAHLIEALRTVAAGGSYVDPELAPLLFEREDLSPLTLLSPRERQTLNLLADGLTGQAIAERLFLSPETIRTHVRNATTKLGAKTRVQAVALVVRAQSSG